MWSTWCDGLPALPARIKSGEKLKTRRKKMERKSKKRQRKVIMCACEWDGMADRCCILHCTLSAYIHTYTTHPVCQYRIHNLPNKHVPSYISYCTYIAANAHRKESRKKGWRAKFASNLWISSFLLSSPSLCIWGLFIKNLIALLIRKVFMNFNLLSLTWGWAKCTAPFFDLAREKKRAKPENFICQTSHSLYLPVMCVSIWMFDSM